MLHIALQEGEYMTIGDNIKIYCSRVGAKNSLSLSVDAPRDLKILRTRHIESELQILANAGDVEAKEALAKLNEEREARKETRKVNLVKRNERRKAKAVS
ncbi:MAG: carbon storage regulator [Defluviitaleaceae bacterium]|nr:carbon storage regulator [Defluviitaleaceae bacterium]